MRPRNRFIFYFLGMLCPMTGFTQTEATQYFMSSLPQASVNNPAFFPGYKYSIGAPILSSVATTYTNNGFSYNGLVLRSGGITMADPGRWTSALTSKNYMTSTAAIDLGRIGVSIGQRVYLQFSATAKEYTRVMIPKEVTSLIYQNIQNTEFSPQLEGTAYLEYAAGAAVKVSKKLTIGARAKYLKGIMNATTVTSDINVSVQPDYAISAVADTRIRTSGVYDANQPGYSFGREFKNYMANNGAGIDLGAVYQLSGKISLAASIIDFGKIYWKNNTYDYVLNPATARYTFPGIDADKLVQGNSSYLGSQGDSIADRFRFQKQKSASYSTWLPGKMYMSGTYMIIKNLKAGFLVFSEKYQNRFSQGASASINKNVGKWLSTTVSYTVSNRSYNNFGAGLSLNLAPIQIYVVGDNLLNAPASLISTGHIDNYLNNTKVFSLRAGVNFVWGRRKESEKGSVKSPRTGKKTPTYIKARKKSS